MSDYVWTQDRTNDQYPLGNPPLWWNTDLTPKLAAVVPSPSGPGDTLVRTELYACAFGALEGILPSGSQPSSLYHIQISLQGEVYTSGASGFPNPDDIGESPAVITAELAPATLSYYETTDFARGSCAWATPGYVTSQGERGPAKYGSGHPELRVGLWADNADDFLLAGALNSTWNIKVRCLWRVP